MAGVLFGEKIEKLVSVSSSGQVWRRSTEMHLASRRKRRSPVSNLMWLKEEIYLVSVTFLHPLMTLLSVSPIFLIRKLHVTGDASSAYAAILAARMWPRGARSWNPCPPHQTTGHRRKKDQDLQPCCPQKPCLLRNEDQMAGGCPLPFPVTYLQEGGSLRSPSCEQNSSNYCFLLIIFV